MEKFLREADEKVQRVIVEASRFASVQESGRLQDFYESFHRFKLLVKQMEKKNVQSDPS